MKWIVCIYMGLGILNLNAQNYALALHGGAGNIRSENIPVEARLAYELKMKEALNAGAEILDTGGQAIDAVVAVIEVLEDSPLFNAGKGAVFTWDEENELDASIMDGRDLNAGAVTGVKIIKNPIKAALAVMNNSDHVMLSGKGAEEFAKKQKLDTVPNKYFQTEKRLQDIKMKKKRQGSFSPNDDEKFSKMGTVGCVVLDKHGNLAAGTSTGGMTGKRWGRIGDSPVIGAGTYADNRTCAISCTGHGEFFIRYAVAHDMSASMEYQGISIEEAAKEIIHNKLKKAGGRGGLIGIDSQGNITMMFNTAGMFRGSLKEGGEARVAMFEISDKGK